MSKAIINLEDFRSEDKIKHIKSKVFTGRDRGEEVRKKSKIDDLEKTNDEIEIRIPADIYSIDPTFFEELFFNVVQKLKKDGFVSKFKLISLGEYNFQGELLEAVDRILNDTTAID